MCRLGRIVYGWYRIRRDLKTYRIYTDAPLPLDLGALKQTVCLQPPFISTHSYILCAELYVTGGHYDQYLIEHSIIRGQQVDYNRLAHNSVGVLSLIFSIYLLFIFD